MCDHSPQDPAHATREAQLLDECMAAEESLYSKRIALCTHAGLDHQADYWRQQLRTVIYDLHRLAVENFEASGLDFFSASAMVDKGKVI